MSTRANFFSKQDVEVEKDIELLRSSFYNLQNRKPLSWFYQLLHIKRFFFLLLAYFIAKYILNFSQTFSLFAILGVGFLANAFFPLSREEKEGAVIFWLIKFLGFLERIYYKLVDLIGRFLKW